MFNLAEQAAAAAAHEDGITVPLTPPGASEPVATIVLAGPDSRRAMEARRAGWRQVLAKRADGDKGDPTEAERREAGTRFLAGCVVSWEGFTADGKAPLDCTVENAVRVFSVVPWVEDLCDLKIGNRSNFTRG